MAAFFVMFLSPISGHRQLGLFGAVGVGLAALFALFILPLFIPVKAMRQRPSAAADGAAPDDCSTGGHGTRA